MFSRARACVCMRVYAWFGTTRNTREQRTSRGIEKWQRERRRELNSPRFLPRSTDLLLPSRQASKIFLNELYVFPRATTKRKLLTRSKVEHFHFHFLLLFFFTRFIRDVALIFASSTRPSLSLSVSLLIKGKLKLERRCLTSDQTSARIIFRRIELRNDWKNNTRRMMI